MKDLQIMKRKSKNIQKMLVTTFIRINPDKPGLDDYEVFGRVLTKKFLQVLTFLNQLKSKLKN